MAARITLSSSATITKQHRILALIFVPLLLAACATSPDGRGGLGGSRGGDMDGPPGGMGGGGASTVVAQIQDQLQRTAEALALAPKQAVLWDAYVEKVSALMADQMKLQFPTKNAKCEELFVF